MFASPWSSCGRGKCSLHGSATKGLLDALDAETKDMTRYTSWLIAGILLTLGSRAPAQTPLTKGGFFVVATGSDTSSDLIGLETIEANEQLVAAYGLTKPAGLKPQYSFLFIFNAPVKNRIGTDTKGNASNATDNFYIDHTSTIRIGKVATEVAYACKYDSKTKKMTSETLKVGDKQVDLDKGRVFLVDVKGKEAVYNQLKVELVPEFDAKEGYVRWTYNAVEKLKKDNADVKKFVE